MRLEWRILIHFIRSNDMNCLGHWAFRYGSRSLTRYKYGLRMAGDTFIMRRLYDTFDQSHE